MPFSCEIINARSLQASCFHYLDKKAAVFGFSSMFLCSHSVKQFSHTVGPPVIKLVNNPLSGLLFQTDHKTGNKTQLQPCAFLLCYCCHAKKPIHAFTLSLISLKKYEAVFIMQQKDFLIHPVLVPALNPLMLCIPYACVLDPYHKVLLNKVCKVICM